MQINYGDANQDVKFSYSGYHFNKFQDSLRVAGAGRCCARDNGRSIISLMIKRK